MKNILSKIAVFAALALSCLTANAQRGFDVFGDNARMITIQSPVQLTNNPTPGTNSFPFTNQPTPVDIHSFTGVGWIHVSCTTNTTDTNNNTSQVITNLVQTGPDLTNWSTLSNCVVVTSNTAVPYTNFYYGGTNLVATNNFLLPGTNYFPNPSTAGWATPALQAYPFTNSASFVLTANQDYLIGFAPDDQARYIRIIWTTGGQVRTNISLSAQFFGVLHN